VRPSAAAKPTENSKPDHPQGQRAEVPENQVYHKTDRLKLRGFDPIPAAREWRAVTLNEDRRGKPKDLAALDTEDPTPQIRRADGEHHRKEDEDRQGGFQQSSTMHQYSVSQDQAKKGKVQATPHGVGGERGLQRRKPNRMGRPPPRTKR
jgi:hypothetical protein